MDEIEFLAGCARQLARVIDTQHHIVDADLSRAAHWRGPLRREIAGRPPDDAERLAQARTFDWLAGMATTAPPLDEPALLDIHRRATGGGAYRTSGITIGGRPVGHPPAGRVAEMTGEALERAGDGSEPAPLASARLHLELALIHPFGDGNGRTARLAASYVLMRAGYRSTLLTAVEQHTCHDPSSYRRSFALLRARGDAAATWTWLTTALGAMALGSQLVAWHRVQRPTRAERGMRAPEDRSARDALAFQLGRLRAEERDDARHG
ncbi:MAG TPA: Fic family protein [Candidatus Dormibacteraeota bacterium]|nr:Fic family protein [Candidatus Dormibacteraeota bacterium]